MADDNSSTTPAAGKRPGLMTLVKAGAALIILVLLQVVGVSMLLPSAAETEELAQKLVTAQSTAEEAEGEAETQTADDAPHPTEEMVEVALGSYHVVTYDVDTGSSLNIDFDLFGTVLASEEGEFIQLYTVTENRLQEQINITVRGADVTELSDPDLDLLKRKILEKTNRTLGKPLVHEAVFSKFSFIER